MSKRCRVLCDTPEGVRQCELDLPDEATIAIALESARLKLGESVVDWQRVSTGIYGRVRSRSYVPADGDRIELYRELRIEPRAARRARASASARCASNPSSRRR
jgi:putative ubiquitin-RnfH superfamily antitoxin RatB of RatAB toxin-antitoxin module